jgi:hypothetical protein
MTSCTCGTALSVLGSVNDLSRPPTCAFPYHLNLTRIDFWSKHDLAPREPLNQRLRASPPRPSDLTDIETLDDAVGCSRASRAPNRVQGRAQACQRQTESRCLELRSQSPLRAIEHLYVIPHGPNCIGRDDRIEV